MAYHLIPIIRCTDIKTFFETNQGKLIKKCRKRLIQHSVGEIGLLCQELSDGSIHLLNAPILFPIQQCCLVFNDFDGSLRIKLDMGEKKEEIVPKSWDYSIIEDIIHVSKAHATKFRAMMHSSSAVKGW